jgi:dienelactone hydrolase
MALYLSALALPLACAPATALSPRTETVDLGGHASKVDIYRPLVNQSGDVAIIAHGFTRTRARHRDLAEALADAGITAVVPDLPHVVDHWGNGDAVVDLERALEGGRLGLPPVPRSRIVLIGTSAGGLATVMAASKLPGLAGWIGLDPVDRTGAGVSAASHLAVPAVVFLGEPSTCNLYGSGKSIGRAVPNLVRQSLLHGASHCDFESPTNKFCRVMCGESSSEMQTLARQITVDAALELLRANGRRGNLQSVAPLQ